MHTEKIIQYVCGIECSGVKEVQVILIFTEAQEINEAGSTVVDRGKY